MCKYLYTAHNTEILQHHSEQMNASCGWELDLVEETDKREHQNEFEPGFKY